MGYFLISAPLINAARWHSTEQYETTLQLAQRFNLSAVLKHLITDLLAVTSRSLN